MKKTAILLTLLFSVMTAMATEMSFPSKVSVYLNGEEVVLDGDVYELPSFENYLEIEFNQAPEYAPTLEMITGGGFWRYNEFADCQKINNETFSYEITTKDWHTPVLGYYNLTVCLTFTEVVDGDREYITNYDGNKYKYYLFLTTKDCGGAQILGTYPDKDSWNEGLSFEQFYNEQIFTYYFSKEIFFEDMENIGYVVYHHIDGQHSAQNFIAYEGEVNEEAGAYQLLVAFDNSIPAEEIKAIDLYLEGLYSYKYEGPLQTPEKEGLDVEPIKIKNNDEVGSPQKIKTRSESKSDSNDINSISLTADVYNTQGILVKKGIAVSQLNSLPKGLYIVNGEKLVIR